MQLSTLIVHQPSLYVTLITLNRVDAANALNMLMAEEITHTFERLSNNKEVRAVVLTGAGERVFCAGADLKERQGMNEEAWEAQHQSFRAARDAILHCPLPVIAAVNGAAYAGGLELALACDFIYTVPHAKFAFTEARLGIMPGLGGTQTLTRAVGTRHAKEILLTGRAFSAEEARVMGLVNRVFEKERLIDEALKSAEAAAYNAPLSTRAIKAAVAEGEHLSLDAALAVELKHYKQLIKSKDREEGINAYNEHREPEFKGE